MRKIAILAATAAFLVGSQAQAGTSTPAPQPSPLAPGKPAGVHKAMSRSTGNLFTYGTYAVAIGIGVWIFHVTTVGSASSTH